MLCLLVDDVRGACDGVLEKCKADGLNINVQVAQPPQVTEKFGIENALLRDPDGYLVELQRFLDPAEQDAFCGK